MLELTIDGEEYWDAEAERFVYPEAVTLQLEHSLVSVSKWEAIWHKPFLTNQEKSDEEMTSYVECMLLTKRIGTDVLVKMSQAQVEEIGAYVNNPMTGTTIAEMPQPKTRNTERLSAELIYFWMNQFQIPYEARHWHLNQLFTLIKIHHAKSQKPQKVSRQKQAQTMSEANAARRKQLGTTG